MTTEPNTLDTAPTRAELYDEIHLAAGALRTAVERANDDYLWIVARETLRHLEVMLAREAVATEFAEVRRGL
jgi:hypothetical protein